MLQATKRTRGGSHVSMVSDLALGVRGMDLDSGGRAAGLGLQID